MCRQHQHHWLNAQRTHTALQQRQGLHICNSFPLTRYESSLHLGGVLQQLAGPEVHQGGMGVLSALPEVIAGRGHVDWEERKMQMLKHVNMTFLREGQVLCI